MTDVAQQGRRRPLPSEDQLNSEIEKMSAGLFTGDDECTALCNSLNNLWDDLQQAATPQEQRTILAEIKAVQARRKILHCRICLAQ
jgi:hypothetical protein